jgi:hypothetical protein
MCTATMRIAIVGIARICRAIFQAACWQTPKCLAERTGLEPATPGVTGRYSNQLNYRSAAAYSTTSNFITTLRCQGSLYYVPEIWRPLGDSNPCTHRERVMS